MSQFLPGYLAGVAGRIFVAGTGRSGTTILHSILSTHPSIYMVPYESKFIVEADGLEELVSYLTDRFTLTHAERALYRFDRFMRQALPGNDDLAMKDFRFDLNLGQDVFYDALNAFVRAIVDYEYDEAVPIDAFSTGYKSLWPSQTPSVRRVVPKMFETREEPVMLARQLVDRMFGMAALRLSRNFWCEKTPSNIFSMRFLWELFPDAAIIHIKRDPRGVFHSLMQQNWAPRNPNATAALLRSIYLRWEWFKRDFDLAGRPYLEIKLEDLVRDPQPILADIVGKVGLPAWTLPPGLLNVESPDTWRTRMTPEARETCERELGRFFPLMGYAL